MTEQSLYVSTKEAIEILGGGMCPQTFIRKFADILPAQQRITNQKHWRWLRAAVEEVARCSVKVG